MMIEIEASVLSADFLRLGEQVRDAETAGVEGIQVDVMDGKFVPNITFGQDIVRALRRVVKGADRLFVHQEACTHIHRVLQSIREFKIEAGVAINPGTSPYVLEEVLNMADIIQVMTVNPGFGGQEFIHSQLDKIRDLREMLENRGFETPIAVDGGIDPTTAPLVVDAGATVMIAGSSIYNEKGSVAQNVVALRESIKK
jgi:ribulose-phosphate 3-epimerase